MVPRLVPQGIVHELEVVDVEREHRDAVLVPVGPGERELQQLVEHRLVGK